MANSFVQYTATATTQVSTGYVRSITLNDDGYGYIPYEYIIDEHLAADFWIIEEVTKDEKKTNYKLSPKLFCRIILFCLAKELFKVLNESWIFFGMPLVKVQLQLNYVSKISHAYWAQKSLGYLGRHCFNVKCLGF